MKTLGNEQIIEAKQGRLHFLDWLRVLVVLAVFFDHTIWVFDLLLWHIRDGQQEYRLQGMVDFLPQLGMSLLFLLAGASTWLALRSRTGKQVLRERFQRLLIPFLAGFILLSPVQAYLETLLRSRSPGPFVRFSLHFFASIHLDWNPRWLGTYGYHLWFLAFLFLVSTLALPLLLFLRRGQGQRFLLRLATFIIRPGSLLVFVLPLALLQMILRIPFPGYQNWADFFSWLLFFLYGSLLLSCPHFTYALTRQGKICLFTAIVSTCLMIAWVLSSFSPAHTTDLASRIEYVLYQFLYSLASWSWIVFILYLGMRFFQRNNAWIAYGNEALLPFYVLHFPVILVTAYIIVHWNVGSIAQFLLISLASLVATLALYELLIRRNPVMRWLFGMKPLKRRAI